MLDAWAAKAAAGHNNNNNQKPGAGSNSNDAIVPAIRARELVETMQDLADNTSTTTTSLEHIRPNEETWYKLIATIALQQEQQRKRKPRTKSPAAAGKVEEEESFGPRGAEAMLAQFETDTESHSATPTILLNRILRAYCANGKRMEEAEAFYHRRCQILATTSRDVNTGAPTAPSEASRFPNEVTFNTILTGWATAAEVAKKREKSRSKSKANSDNEVDTRRTAAAVDMPHRAEAWLEEMRQQQHSPSTRSYGSILQVWSLSTRNHEDAANRAEELLRRHVWKTFDDHDGNDSVTTAGNHQGITICTNIVLRAWSNQIVSALPTRVTNKANGVGIDSSGLPPRPSLAVGRCIRLFHDFLTLPGEIVKPTAETFRAVLHAIVSPSNGMTPLQKYDHSKALLTCMKDVYRIRPGPDDLRKFERIESVKKSYLQRQRTPTKTTTSTRTGKARVQAQQTNSNKPRY